MLSEPVSRLCFSQHKIGKSKLSTLPYSGGDKLTVVPCSAKELPQEVKDGLEIIHVGYGPAF